VLSFGNSWHNEVPAQEASVQGEITTAERETAHPADVDAIAQAIIIWYQPDKIRRGKFISVAVLKRNDSCCAA